MKILLLGYKGYLGSYLADHLDVDTLDLRDRRLISNNEKYNYVINCIGKPDLEYCEKNIPETDYSNWMIVSDIRKFYPESKIINFSSYYVYNHHSMCTETSETTSKYAYCRQKLLSEKECTNGVTFRLGKLFGNVNAKQNKLTDYIIDNNEVTLDKTLFNPVSVSQVLSVIKYELKYRCLTGVFNLANYGVTSHYKYGLAINSLLGTSKKINIITKLQNRFDNYGRFAMSLESLRSRADLHPWQDDLKSYIQSLNS